MAILKSVFFVKQEIEIISRYKRSFCSEVDKATKSSRQKQRGERIKETFEKVFSAHEHIAKIRAQIPESLFVEKCSTANALYLVDEHVAKQAVKYILPNVSNLKNHIVCESNPGLGLITSNLLNNKVKSIRLYEPKTDFLPGIQKLKENYPGRIDLIHMSFFLLGQYEYFDKFSKLDKGTRMYHITKGVPKKSWSDDPVMTVIGASPNSAFLQYLTNALYLQKDIASFGRLQLFLFMKPRDFQKITAAPNRNGLSCCPASVLFNLLFNWELLDKYPRNVFLPWEHRAATKRKSKYDIGYNDDELLFVKINCKEEFPISLEYLSKLHNFVNVYIRKKHVSIIEELEQQLVGIGLNILVPLPEHQDLLADVSIFTKFSELTPEQLLCIFKEAVRHPQFATLDDYMRLVTDKTTNDTPRQLDYSTVEESVSN